MKSAREEEVQRQEGKEQEHKAEGQEMEETKREDLAGKKESETAGMASEEEEDPMQQEGATMPSAAALTQEWTCGLCTLVNTIHEPRCVLCNSLRETKEGGLVACNEEGKAKRRACDGACCPGMAQLEALKQRNEQLLQQLKKLKDSAEQDKEQKERFASYENLMLAALTDEELQEVERELETKLRLVRQVRRDQARAQTQALEQENREMRAAAVCLICADAPRAITFAPCGHFVSCADCCEEVEHCPVCRKWISLRLKTFTS